MNWIKTIGVTGYSVPQQWWEGRRNNGVDFSASSNSIEVGDRAIIYICGTGKYAGIVEITGDLYEANRHESWPHRMDCDIIHGVEVDKGGDLRTLSNTRDLMKSIQRHSHIRATDQEMNDACKYFGITP